MTTSPRGDTFRSQIIDLKTIIVRRRSHLPGGVKRRMRDRESTVVFTNRHGIIVGEIPQIPQPHGAIQTRRDEVMRLRRVQREPADFLV